MGSKSEVYYSNGIRYIAIVMTLSASNYFTVNSSVSKKDNLKKLLIYNGKSDFHVYADCVPILSINVKQM